MIRFRLSVFCCVLLVVLAGLGSTAYFSPTARRLTLAPGTRIALIGNNLGSRMMNYGVFESELHVRYPDHQLVIRNLCDGGDTPGFRPHSARNDPWPFPGAERFQTELAQPSESEGHFPKPDEWLTTLKTDVVVGFFGFSESYAGPAGLPTFRAELAAFIEHTRRQRYNGTTAPQLALVSPIAFEDRSGTYDLPNGKRENANLRLYAQAMEEVARQYDVSFVDAFSPSLGWYGAGRPLTIDGLQLSEAGYRTFAPFLVDALFGKAPAAAGTRRKAIEEAVLEKNWYWHHDYKIPNGVHAYGRRYKPFGPDNYPAEIEKVRQMTLNRDTLIWRTATGRTYDLAAADARTPVLPPVQTNYKPDAGVRYLYGEEAMSRFTIAPGFKIELFASEKEFPDLANPSQLSFDNRGRLWVAVMPTYPHYRPGDARPNDKILILEDTDGDFKADKQTIFADHLHIPAGFELTPEGVYISQGTNLKLYTDTNGDDRADRVEIVLSGFDDHDTHHVISAFCADPSGAIYMGEGVFLHTNVETPYGTVRATNGGFMRYNPQRKMLERTAQLPIPNPWGIAFDDWGQNFYESTSSPDVAWMMPGSTKPIYGISAPESRSLIEQKHRVRPTSGLEFVSSRHFPDEMQGDLMLNNTIGFLGTKVHRIQDDGTGYKVTHRVDLLSSSDPNFRPVDMEFAPDGSLYLIDWHNVLIGHMQHNARDPLRDHVHGRVYRITYPARPLVKPAPVAGASLDQLLDNLKLPEYRTRYRTRRELRGRRPAEVLVRLKAWAARLDPKDPRYEHHLLEGLWVSWGLNRVDQALLRRLLQSTDYRVRAAAVRVLRYTGHQVPDQPALLAQAAGDPHGRVRLEALVAGTWLPTAQKSAVLAAFERHPIDDWMQKHYDFIKNPTAEWINSNLKKKPTSPAETQLALGKEIYGRDGFCATCHQADGSGLESAGFPPLAKSTWVTGNPERLIKLVMHGLYGPIEVNGRRYPGQVPMTPYGGMLNDNEMAAVLNYIRSSFGNKASVPITAEGVRQVREQTKDRKGFYTPAELLQQHPD
jgi:mono/diheme cytochrome c family protein/glucose/arabinose dehydrogenase